MYVPIVVDVPDGEESSCENAKRKINYYFISNFNYDENSENVPQKKKFNCMAKGRLK